MKPRFRIGDYVEVKAITLSERGSKPQTEDDLRRWKVPVCIKVLKRVALTKPIRGWIVGAVRRFEGTVNPPYGKGEDYEDGYLSVSGSKLLWKVAQSLTNIPREVADEDVTLVAQPNNWTHQYLNDKHEWTEIPQCPMKLGTPWDTACWSPEDQRKEMKSWPRDKNGRWLKKPKQEKDHG